MQGELYHVGVDWLTVTTGDSTVAPKVLLKAMAMAKDLENQGERRKGAKFQGYDGESVGPMFFGTRTDGLCVRVSSIAAEPFLQVLQGDNVNVTRLDIQATVILPNVEETYARTIAGTVVGESNQRPVGRRCNVRLVESFGAGDSVLLGSRTSEAYGRIYDKHKESKGSYPENAWRFEVEYKKSQAQQVYQALVATEARTEAILGLLNERYKRWGVDAPIGNYNAPCNVATLHHSTDTDKLLNWLDKSVRPAVRTLLDRGQRAAVLHILGLE